MVEAETGKPHEEIPVKVTAWVDRGVAPLVVALNDFEQVLTVDSCERNRSIPTDDGAYVMFHVQGDYENAARWASNLARELKGLPCLLQAEWRPQWDDGDGSGEPLLILSCSPEEVPRLAAAVANAAAGSSEE